MATRIGVRRSSARQLDGEAAGAERLRHLLTVVALHLDHAVLDRSARAAEPLQRGRDLGQAFLAARQAGDHSHGLAAALLTVAGDAHDTVRCGAVLRPAVAADAAGERTLTV